MKLAPGPIPPLTSDWFDPFPEDPGLELFYAGDDRGLDQLEREMDALLSPTAALDDTIPDLGELSILHTIEAALPTFGGPLEASIEDHVIDGEIVARDVQLVHVYDVIPGEAWGPPLDPLIGYGAPPPVVNTRITSGGIKNLSNPGSPSLFGVGDSYEWDLAGFVEYVGEISQGVLVRGFFTKDGVKVNVPWNRSSDSKGNVTFSGTWTAADIGHWSGYFDTPGKLADGQYYTPVPDWDVQSAPVPPAPIIGPPGVTIRNITRPGAQDFSVGDRWAVLVYGNPGDDVIVSLVWNGAQLKPVSVGKIGPDGALELFGVMGPNQVGSYVETYIVNLKTLPGTLNFTVS